MKTSQQLDQKIHLKILLQNLQYERYDEYENEDSVDCFCIIMELSSMYQIIINIREYFTSRNVFFSSAGSRQGDLCRRRAGIPHEATGKCAGMEGIGWIWQIGFVFLISNWKALAGNDSIYLFCCVLQSLLAKQPATPTRGATVSLRRAMRPNNIYLRIYFMNTCVFL